MNKGEIVKRYIILTLGLFISALGVACTKSVELGVSPISSVANVMSYRFDALSLGNWIIIWNMVLILGQIIILRKNFKWIQLLQIPLSFAFGWFTDFGMWLVSPLQIQAYPLKILMILLGIVLLGFGISLTVMADQIMNSGEAFVKALADTFHKEFGKVKLCFDIFCVLLAVVLSMIFFQGQILGTREGTVITACCTGLVVGFFNKLFRKQKINKASSEL